MPPPAAEVEDRDSMMANLFERLQSFRSLPDDYDGGGAGARAGVFDFLPSNSPSECNEREGVGGWRVQMVKGGGGKMLRKGRLEAEVNEP